MTENKRFTKEINALEQGKGKYAWDELEELIEDAYFDGSISEEEHEDLMKHLMDIPVD